MRAFMHLGVAQAELGHADAACEAHEAIELRRAAHSGRGLHVSRGCASGTLLLREEAFVAVLRRALDEIGQLEAELVTAKRYVSGHLQDLAPRAVQGGQR